MVLLQELSLGTTEYFGDVCVLFLMGKYFSHFVNKQLRHKEVKGPDEGDSKSNCLEFCSSEISSF